MQINWKVRFRNPVFWVTALPMAVSFVYTCLGLYGIVPKLSESAVVNLLLMAVELLSFIGILVDPTTSGASDSKQALAYVKPKKEGYYE